tara:strand:+ start:376 stop:855 length:480 start_codon:yes stop_codon:yes gene_type:complete
MNIIIEKKEFVPHMMYDPNSEKKEKTEKEEDHDRLGKKGYIHIDPQILRKILRDEGGAAGMKPFLDSDAVNAEEEEIKAALDSMNDVGQHEDGDYILADDKEVLIKIIKEELKIVLEKRKKKDDRCTRIAKRKYDVWPSAYASGAVVRCRQGKIWKGEK